MRVQFFADSALVGSDTRAPYALSWKDVAAGTYTITAKATDNSGVSTTSAPTEVVVVPSVVKGRIDRIGVNSGGDYEITGWACSTGHDSPIAVDLYLGGRAGSGIGLGRYLADAPSEPAVAAACQADGTAYRFAIAIDDSVRQQHANKRVYIHGISPFGNGNYLLGGSGNFVIPAPVALSRHYVYNKQQELCKVVEPETNATIMAYDAAGNLAWSAAGQPYLSTSECNTGNVPVTERTVRSYDTRNRLRTVTYPDHRGDTVTTYTLDGLPETIVATDGTHAVTTTYSYNARRLLERETLQWGGRSWQIDYGYTGAGHLASHRYPDGLTISYAPNAFGQPTQVETFASGVTYHPNGAIAGFTYGNGVVHSLIQNDRDLPERSRDVAGAVVIHDDSYDYDFNGNLAAISDGRPGQPGNRTMTYDSRDRLIGVMAPMFGGDGRAIFGYDGLDNLTRARVGEHQDVSYQFDEHNRLTNVLNPAGATVIGLGYDDQGNVANKSGQVFDFDYGNRLRGIEGVADYVYDGLGRRITDVTSAPKYSQYSRTGKLLFTADLRSSLDSNYIYLGGSLIAIRERDRTSGALSVRYQHTDGLGTPVAVTDEAGTTLQRSDYGPFGSLLNRPGEDGPGYTGHVLDQATGLNYMQQRYYDPMLGIFLSVDPVNALSNPITFFNRYRYAISSPYAYIDPDGRAPDEPEREHKNWATLAAHKSNLSGVGAITSLRSEPAETEAESAGGQSSPSSRSTSWSAPALANDEMRQPLYCGSGADCDFMYNQTQFLEGRIGSDEFLDRTQAQGAAGTIGGIIGGAAWAGPGLAAAFGRMLGPSGRILGHPAYGGRTLNFLKSGKYRFGWGRDGGPVLRMGIKNEKIDIMRRQVPRP